MSEPQPLEGVRDVFIGAYATDDREESPEYAHIAVTEEFLQKLLRLQVLCEKEGLSEARH
jgi:hypothetical protein